MSTIANESNVSAVDYSRARRILLGQSVTSKTRIYLDVKYWIYCRDAWLGKPAQPLHADIWIALCQLVDSGVAICPASYPVLVETLKQRDHDRRRATSAVVDRLSRHVAIRPLVELMDIELYHFYKAMTVGRNAVHPLDHLVWTFVGWVAGEIVPSHPGLSDVDNNTLHRWVFDRMANVSFSALVDSLAESDIGRFDTPAFYEQLNQNASRHDDEVTSFGAVLASEVAGILDILRPRMADLFRHDYEQTTGNPAPIPDSPEVIKGVQMMVNLLYHAYRLKRLNTEFPAVHVGSGIHAAKRHRRQPFRKGDHWDHEHAHAALAYCDAFLTERSLGSILSTSPLEYDRLYKCRVLWSDAQVFEYLQWVAGKSGGT